MNPRIAVALVALLVVVGGGALYYQYQERTQKADNAAALGRPLLKDLKLADVAAIKIAEPKQAITLQRREDGWVIPERRNFPADLNKVREFALKLISLKVGQSEPIGPKDRARLSLDANATELELDGANGKPLGKLLVGRKYFKREVDNQEKAAADGRFIALPGEERNVYVVSDPLTQASARTAEWIDRSSFEVEKVKTLEVRPSSGQGGYRIERTKDDADWKLAGLKPGEKLDTSRCNAASYSLSLLELADVASDTMKDTGLDNPTLINATTLDGLTYEIKVGRLEGDNYFVRFSSSGSVPEPKEGDKGPDAERLKKLAERRAHEKQLSEYVLLIPKSKLEDTLKPRAELLEKKEPKK